MKHLALLLALLPAIAIASEEDPCELRISNLGPDPVYMGSIGYLSVDPK